MKYERTWTFESAEEACKFTVKVNSIEKLEHKIRVFEQYVIDTGCSHSGEGEAFECDYAYPWECPDCPINLKTEYIEDIIARKALAEKEEVCEWDASGCSCENCKKIKEVSDV